MLSLIPIAGLMIHGTQSLWDIGSAFFKVGESLILEPSQSYEYSRATVGPLTVKVRNNIQQSCRSRSEAFSVFRKALSEGQVYAVQHP